MNNTTESTLIGKRIKDARIKAGLTQNRLHEMTDISITQLSAYENGNRNIGLISLKKIADATGTSIDELYTGKREDKPLNADNIGKLIINCITALVENDVICTLPTIDENEYVPTGMGYIYQIGFYKYVDILDDYVKKLIDFHKNENNYPNPQEFKRQIIEAASKKINYINSKINN